MNILIFGPNGSGKGTQGALLRERLGLVHIEAGALFRENIRENTPLGSKARAFVERGELVPDEITVPMVLERLKRDDCRSGWLLDGFPRNLSQAEALLKALQKDSIKLDYIVEIVLAREVAKKRIMGRRLCPRDNNHPNNIYIEAIAPLQKGGKLYCRVCGEDNLIVRPDDQDEAAIDKRHSIYYDRVTGTMAAIDYFRRGKVPFISVDGLPPVEEVANCIIKSIIP